MGFPIHTIVIPAGMDGYSEGAWIKQGLMLAVPYVAGVGGGAIVSTPIAFAATADMPANYGVFVEVGADVTAYISAKTAAGFTLNIEPRLSASTVAAGTANILIVA